MTCQHATVEGNARAGSLNCERWRALQMRTSVWGVCSKGGASRLFPSCRPLFAQPRIAADRFAREIGGFLQGSFPHTSSWLFAGFAPGAHGG